MRISILLACLVSLSLTLADSSSEEQSGSSEEIITQAAVAKGPITTPAPEAHTITPNTLETLLACENESKDIVCPTGTVILIADALYGRANAVTCPYPGKMSNVHCRAPDTLRIVRDKCEGKLTCNLSSFNDLFTNPCEDTFKYLRIDYVCRRDLHPTTTTEPSTTISIVKKPKRISKTRSVTPETEPTVQETTTVATTTEKQTKPPVKETTTVATTTEKQTKPPVKESTTTVATTTVKQTKPPVKETTTAATTTEKQTKPPVKETTTTVATTTVKQTKPPVKETTTAATTTEKQTKPPVKETTTVATTTEKQTKPPVKETTTTVTTTTEKQTKPPAIVVTTTVATTTTKKYTSTTEEPTTVTEESNKTSEESSETTEESITTTEPISSEETTTSYESPEVDISEEVSSFEESSSEESEEELGSSLGTKNKPVIIFLKHAHGGMTIIIKSSSFNPSYSAFSHNQVKVKYPSKNSGSKKIIVIIPPSAGRSRPLKLLLTFPQGWEGYRNVRIILKSPKRELPPQKIVIPLPAENKVYEKVTPKTYNGVVTFILPSEDNTDSSENIILSEELGISGESVSSEESGSSEQPGSIEEAVIANSEESKEGIGSSQEDKVAEKTHISKPHPIVIYLEPPRDGSTFIIKSTSFNPSYSVLRPGQIKYKYLQESSGSKKVIVFVSPSVGRSRPLKIFLNFPQGSSSDRNIKFILETPKGELPPQRVIVHLPAEIAVSEQVETGSNRGVMTIILPSEENFDGEQTPMVYLHTKTKKMVHMPAKFTIPKHVQSEIKNRVTTVILPSEDNIDSSEDVIVSGETDILTESDSVEESGSWEQSKILKESGSMEESTSSEQAGSFEEAIIANSEESKEGIGSSQEEKVAEKTHISKLHPVVIHLEPPRDGSTFIIKSTSFNPSYSVLRPGQIKYKYLQESSGSKKVIVFVSPSVGRSRPLKIFLNFPQGSSSDRNIKFILETPKGELPPQRVIVRLPAEIAVPEQVETGSNHGVMTIILPSEDNFDGEQTPMVYLHTKTKKMVHMPAKFTIPKHVQSEIKNRVTTVILPSEDNIDSSEDVIVSGETDILTESDSVEESGSWEQSKILEESGSMEESGSSEQAGSFEDLFAKGDSEESEEKTENSENISTSANIHSSEKLTSFEESSSSEQAGSFEDLYTKGDSEESEEKTENSENISTSANIHSSEPLTSLEESRSSEQAGSSEEVDIADSVESKEGYGNSQEDKVVEKIHVSKHGPIVIHIEPPSDGSTIIIKSTSFNPSYSAFSPGQMKYKYLSQNSGSKQVVVFIEPSVGRSRPLEIFLNFPQGWSSDKNIKFILKTPEEQLSPQQIVIPLPSEITVPEHVGAENNGVMTVILPPEDNFDGEQTPMVYLHTEPKNVARYSQIYHIKSTKACPTITYYEQNNRPHPSVSFENRQPAHVVYEPVNLPSGLCSPLFKALGICQ